MGNKPAAIHDWVWLRLSAVCLCCQCTLLSVLQEPLLVRKLLIRRVAVDIQVASTMCLVVVASSTVSKSLSMMTTHMAPMWRGPLAPSRMALVSWVLHKRCPSCHASSWMPMAMVSTLMPLPASTTVPLTSSAWGRRCLSTATAGVA